MKKILSKYWHWILVSLLFVVLLLFVAGTTVFDLAKTKESVRRLHREIERYEAQIEADSLFLENIKTDEFLEKYAREKHLMHSADEQLFLVE